MHGFISDLHWVMPQCIYLQYTTCIPYMESHNWENTKILTSCVFPNVRESHHRDTAEIRLHIKNTSSNIIHISVGISDN